MKKVLFYTETKWAYGIIHYALCKELYKHNILADVLNWDLQYTQDEFNLLIDKYDLFVTTAPLVLKLHRNYKVPLNKISATAHGQWDLLLAKHEADFDFYPHIHSFGVISNILKNKCKEWNFSRIPKVVETGIHFDLFYAPPSEQLRVVGYGGIKQTYNFFNQEIKRGHLVEKACEDLEGICLKSSGSYSYLCMPSYYKTIDAVVMSSMEEAGGLPMLEAAAAGRLCIGTPVGFFEENAPNGGGILVPLEENQFVESVKETILYYKDNPGDYINKCLEVQNYARENYDWSNKIGPWLELLG